MRLPQDYEREMRRLLGGDYPLYADSLEEPRHFGLRVNELKISVDKFREMAPFELESVPWTDNGFYYKEEDKPALHPYYYAGLFYIQEPSAMTPAAVIDIKEGDTVLDLCAAPGGKSTQAGVRLGGKGLLVSNDISASRAKALLKNIELFGIPNATIISENPYAIREKSDIKFDKIILDAPCSGEGMFRKDPKLRSSWEQNGPDVYSPIQREIIGYAADLLKPGGMMVYSTCTFNEQENEGTLISLLSSRDDMELVDIPKEYGFYPGLSRTDEQMKYHTERAVRIYPFAVKGEGHFVSLLKKKGEHIPASTLAGRRNDCKLSDEFFEFESHLKCPFKKDRLRVTDGKVYYVPEIEFANASQKIRYLRNGVLVGEEKKKRFEPSQALAMTIGAGEFDNVISLSSDDVRVEKYLKGETLNFTQDEISGNYDGTVLFCTDGFALGWGKLSGTVMKNKYLPGWRKA